MRMAAETQRCRLKPAGQIGSSLTHSEAYQIDGRVAEIPAQCAKRNRQVVAQHGKELLCHEETRRKVSPYIYIT